MTTIGWILMILTYSILLSVLGFCFKKIMSGSSEFDTD